MESYIQEKQEKKLELLQRLVNIDSGSYYKIGVDTVSVALKAKYEEMGIVVQAKEETKFGNNMIIQHRDAVDPEIILVAHMDIVFPIGTTAKHPQRENRAYGPGVVDMKASQVEAYFYFKDIARPWR